MSLARFNLRFRPEGVEVEVDGTPVPGVKAVRVEGAEGSVARVTLEALGQVTVEGVGVVEASQEGREELLELLGAIDPAVLENQVLEGLGLGDGGPLAGRYLEQIARYVRGD